MNIDFLKFYKIWLDLEKIDLILHDDEDKQQYEQFLFDQDEDESNYLHDW